MQPLGLTLPRTARADRPWCYTSKPGLWGFCDCNGQDQLGVQWKISEWGDCPVTCDGGLRTSEVECIYSDSGAPADSHLCGQVIPPML